MSIANTDEPRISAAIDAHLSWDRHSNVPASEAERRISREMREAFAEMEDGPNVLHPNTEPDNDHDGHG
jgi:hypothetical protein